MTTTADRPADPMTADPSRPDPMRPDPMRPDPMPAAALGMWLFVSGEAMFFAGLLSAFIVLQSAPAERALFARSAGVVSLPLTVLAGVLLVATAAVLWRGAASVKSQLAAAGLAVAFLGVQAWAGQRLLSHHTVVTPTDVYDGRVRVTPADLRLTGVRVPLAGGFDVSRTVPADLRGGVPGVYAVLIADVRADAVYGPSRNNYFACYFVVGGAHALHVLGGLIALGWLAVRTARRTATPVQVRTVTLYWQFVNGVGLFALVLLSLG